MNILLLSELFASNVAINFSKKPLLENNKNLLVLEIPSGRSTPYYYKADGVMEAYIRVGNESVIAPDYIVNELILKETNQSFDTLTTNAGKLMTDQHTVYNSRMFCTRWNGLEKGSIFDDALDDKEYEGNLIY